jgi:ribokinase
VVGSINIDLVASSPRIPSIGETIIGTDFQVHPGGKGANQAVAIGRLGHPVRLIGRVGSDAFGSQLLTDLQSGGVDCTAVGVSDGPSGVAVILVSDAGDNCIVVAPGANALVSPADIDSNLGIIRQAGMVLAQLEIPLETIEYLAAVCAREDVPLMLDPAPARPLNQTLLQRITWFTPNETEAKFYTDALGENSDPSRATMRILEQGCKGVVLKMGSRGAYIHSSLDRASAIPAFPVKAVDTTAAGDAFNGAFATGLMLGKAPLESARIAVAAAAISVTRRGAQPSMATMDEVHELLVSSGMP